MPEWLEDVIADYGQTFFKLKVGGAVNADLQRLTEIAAVLDAIPEPYQRLARRRASAPTPISEPAVSDDTRLA